MAMGMVQDFQDISNEYLLNFYNRFEYMYPSFAESMRKELLDICGGVRARCGFPVSVMDITMLRTNIAAGHYAAEVLVYGGEHFFDADSMTAGEIDISPVFRSYEELGKRILKECRKYPLKASVYDARAYMLSLCADFYKTVTYTLRKNIYEWKETEEFRAVPFSRDFEINCGEYAAYTETVYIRRRSKDAEEERKWLASGENCCFADFTGLDLAGGVYKKTDLRYSDFSGGILKGCSFRYCQLDFSYLRGVSAQGAVFGACTLNGTDFTGADLRGAVFDDVDNNAFYEVDKPLLFMEYRLSFCNADLRGARFSGTYLANVDFTGADLTGARLDEPGLASARLTREQKDKLRMG